jgi:hypothetical protein
MFSSFAVGFSLATLLIANVSIRPNIKRALVKAGLVKGHKARTPQRQYDSEFDLDLL